MLFVVADPIEMAESGLCGDVGGFGGVFAEIVNDGACGGESVHVVVEAEAGEFGDAKLFAEDARGVIVLESPIFDAAFDSASAVEERDFRGLEKLLRPRKERLARMQELEFFAKGFLGARAAKFRGLKFSGGEVNEGETDYGCCDVLRNSREKIVFASVEDGDVGGGSRCDHADDFAANEFFARAGRFHLVANGDFEAGANEARDVAVGGVIGDAAHGDGLAFFAIAGSERDLELARGEDGVFVEEFVEIAEAEEEQRVRVTRFDRVVLLHERCGGVGHERVVSLQLSVVS